MNSIKNKFLSTEIAFVICSIFFGALLLILTPPMQSADEQYHFTRAYSIANGHIKALKSGNTMGNFLPEGFQEFANSYSELYTNKNAHTSFEEIRKTENIKTTSENKFFCHQSYMALYSPAAYLPQVAGIALAQLFTGSILWLLVSAKVSLLIFYTIAGYFSIKALPFLKNAAFLILLMPMSLSMGASVSADGVLIAISVLYFAKILQYSYSAETLSKKQFFFLMFLAIMLALIKQSFLVTLFALFIPPEKFSALFKTQKLNPYPVKIILLLLPAFLASLLWSQLILGIYVPIHGANPGLQIEFILHHPAEYLKSLALTLNMYFKLILFSTIGILGWLDIIFRPYVYWSYISVLFLNIIFTPGALEKISSGIFQKLLLIGLFALNIFVISTIIYVTWVPPYYTGIWGGLQGRYFIPVLLPFLAFLFLLYNRYFKPQKAQWINLVNGLLLLITYFNAALALFLRYFY